MHNLFWHLWYITNTQALYISKNAELQICRTYLQNISLYLFLIKKLAIIICAQENVLIETALLGMFWLS